MGIIWMHVALLVHTQMSIPPVSTQYHPVFSENKEVRDSTQLAQQQPI